MLFKVKAAALAWKCLAVNTAGYRLATAVGQSSSGPSSSSTSSFSSFVTTRNFMTDTTSSSTRTPGTSSANQLPVPPKRGPSIFARFLKDYFKDLPTEMAVKDKFRKTCQAWHTLDEDKKEEYKRLAAEAKETYQEELKNYLSSMSADDLEQFKKEKKQKLKEKMRAKIKAQLRKLNYPKRPCSSYIFYMQTEYEKKYAPGKMPGVGTAEHTALVGELSSHWRGMSPDEKKPFIDRAENDRKRYFRELEEWKAKLAKNEDELKKLEQLSRKMESVSLDDVKMKAKAKKPRALAAAAKLKAKKAKDKAKKAAAAQKKSLKLAGSKKGKAVKGASKVVKKAKSVKATGDKKKATKKADKKESNEPLTQEKPEEQLTS